MRLMNQFAADKERISRERHESAIGEDIASLFGQMETLAVEGYNEDTDIMLQKESSNSFIYVKPMRIVKTFVYEIFQKRIKEPVKRFLVEGYFDNKNFQNNMANVFFQCDHAIERIEGFEEGLSGNGRTSVPTLRRFIEEMKKGKDVGVFVTKIVDAVNERAKNLVESETNFVNMLGDSLYDIIADFKKPTPELITNMRTLGSGKNKDLITEIASGYNMIQKFIKVMRNFTIIKIAQPGAEPAPETPAEPIPEIDMEDDAE
jgi:hypothetical protein